MRENTRFFCSKAFSKSRKLKIFGNSNRVSRNLTEHKDTERKNEEKSDDKKEGKLPSSRLDKIREKLSVLQKKMFN